MASSPITSPSGSAPVSEEGANIAPEWFKQLEDIRFNANDGAIVVGSTEFANQTPDIVVIPDGVGIEFARNVRDPDPVLNISVEGASASLLLSGGDPNHIVLGNGESQIVDYLGVRYVFMKISKAVFCIAEKGRRGDSQWVVTENQVELCDPNALAARISDVGKSVASAIVMTEHGMLPLAPVTNS